MPKGKKYIDRLSLVRKFAEKLKETGDGNLLLLIWAVIAGLSQTEEDLKIFQKMVSTSKPRSLRPEAMMVLVRLLLETGNLEEARRTAADMHLMEHYSLHALAQLRIFRISGDRDDAELAAQMMKELLASLEPV